MALLVLARMEHNSEYDFFLPALRPHLPDHSPGSEVLS